MLGLNLLMETLIKDYIKNEFYLARPKNTKTIIIDDLVFRLAQQVFSIDDETIDRLIEEVKEEIDYDVYILTRDNMSSQWMEIKETPDNHFILLDLLRCVGAMKIRSFNSGAWYEYLRYLENVITDEIISQNKKPLE